MKKFTKLLGIVLIIALVMSMGTMALAAPTMVTGDKSITITADSTYNGNLDGNVTYTYYQVLLADIGTLGAVTEATGELSGDPGTVAYYVTDATVAGVIDGLKVNIGTEEAPNEKDLFTVTQTADKSRYVVTLAYEDATASQIADALDSVKTNFANATATRTSGSPLKIDGLAAGYYLITSNLGSKLAVQTVGDVTIKEKNTYPSIDKKQNSEQAGSYADTDVGVKVGDTIYYQVTVVVPANANGDITVTDTMSDGLKYNGTLTFDPSLTADVAAKAAEGENPAVEAKQNDYAETTPAETDAWTWKVTIHPTANTLGKTITITYSATVTADALSDTTRENEVELKYKDFTQTGEVKYKTYATGAVKFNGDTVKKTAAGELDLDEGALQDKSETVSVEYLSGAEFELQLTDGTKINVIKDGDYYRPIDPTADPAETAASAIVSDSKGQIIIRGLDNEKNYQLVETKAPAGYNLLTTPATLTLVEDKTETVQIDALADDATQEVKDATTVIVPASVAKIENNKGTQLPSTGGIGTTIFYVVGSILVVAAGVLLITKQRMSREG